MIYNNLHKEYIEFDKVIDKRQNLKTGIWVKQQRIKRNPHEKEVIEAEIEDLKSQIPEVDAFLATRPPAPELPPSQPLIKVSGVIEQLEIMKVVGYFQLRDYDPEAFAQQQDNQQMGSLLLAIIGQGAASAVTSQSEPRLSSYCDFVRGQINGKAFYGWLGRTLLQEGDYVDMAVMDKGDQYVVYGIANPEKRVISVTPRCGQGLNGFIKSLKFSTKIINFGLFGFFFAIMVAALTLKEIIIFILIYIVCDPLLYYVICRLERKERRKNCLLAEDIFEALGFAEPTNVDLVKLTKQKIKSDDLPAEQRQPEWPDKYCDVNYLFYY